MQRLKPSVSSKPPSRKTPFQPAHELQYGLKVMAKDASGVVCSVRCQFCKYFGREESKNGKRRRTQNQKFYKPPYRPQYYTDHNTTAHGIKWVQYQALSSDEKSAFFSGQISHNNQLSSHYEVESSTLSFDIPEHIVTDLIGKIYFNDEDEGASEPVALRAFGDADAGVYRLQIKTPFRFNLAIQHMSAGLSFRQAATVIQQHYQATGNNKLYGMTDTLASTYARYLVAISFQRIGELMANSYMWAFAFASDISTHYERSFMDQCLRLAVDGVLVNIHLLAIPVFERHTAIVQFNLISTTLDVLYGQWRDKMIGVASDGENTMTGRHAGVVTLLENEATHPILRVWCAAHQMDLVMKAAFAIVDDGNFVKNTKDLIVHLRRQKLLIADMGTAAKKLTNRWLYMGNALEWILRNHAQVNTHCEGHQSASPSSSWWVNAAVVYGITSVVNVTFTRIQAKDMILSQQMKEIKRLVAGLRSLLSIQPRIDSMIPHGINDTVTDKFWLKQQDLLNFVKDQGSFVRNYLDSLTLPEKQSTLQQLGKFAVYVIEGMELVQAERDSNNKPAQKVAPPVMPSELVLVNPRDFGENILEPRRAQLMKFWSLTQIEAAEREHRELFLANKIDDSVRSALDKEDYNTSFNDGWDILEEAVKPKTYSHLRQFCCGLATVFANTASVESDFSVLKWELNDRRTALTSLALEGIFQAKQFDQLSKLSERK